MKINKILIYLFLILPLLSSCEDVVRVNLNESAAILTIDAFINQDIAKQTIRISTTAPYFQNQVTPPVGGAIVTVTNTTSNRVFTFADRGNGNYEYTSPNGTPIGRVGDNYVLAVRYNGEDYISQCTSNRTATIDSIVYQFEEVPTSNTNAKSGYYAEFYGFDAKGKVDFYWGRGYRNGVFNSNPNEVNYIADATRNYAPGVQGSDGLPFIAPVRDRMTNPLDPYQVGDSAVVELWSINEETYDFLRQAETQMTNGGLFARIPENVRTNITPRNNAANKVLGWFCVSEISRRGLRIKEVAKGKKGKG
jgi:hypothetical protein